MTASGFATLNGIPFRINPDSIQWAFNIDTNVVDTIGGRVVQVIGATLSDITLAGDFGERKGHATDAAHKHQTLTGKGLLSWEMAEVFLGKVKDMMVQQSADARRQGLMHPPIDFRFPEFGWHFGVYVKAIDDGKSGAAIMHSTGAFAYRYSITLFIVDDRSDDIVIASGRGTSLTNKKKSAAINGYISRISAGVGWKINKYTEPLAVQKTANAATPDSTKATQASSALDS